MMAGLTATAPALYNNETTRVAQKPAAYSGTECNLPWSTQLSAHENVESDGKEP